MTVKKVIALVLVLAVLAAGVLYVRKIENADQETMRDLYSEVEPLQRQREALVKERDGLELDYALMMRDVGTIQLLIQELDPRIFTDVYPLMRDRGIVGVMGISLSQYPDAFTKLSKDQYDRLLMDGWGSCFVYERGYSFENWYRYLVSLLERDSIPVPTAIFFPDDTYSSEFDEMLIEFGIQTVIVNARDGRSATVTDVDSALWFTGAMPWNYTGVTTDTELLARTDGANLTFTMSFDNLWDAYEQEPFIRVLDSWQEMLDVDDPLEDLAQPTPTPNPADPTLVETPEDQLLKPLLKSSNFETALAAHREAKHNNAALEAELAQRQAELDEQIAQLDEQIRAIYDQWEQAGQK